MYTHKYIYIDCPDGSGSPLLAPAAEVLRLGDQEPSAAAPVPTPASGSVRDLTVAVALVVGLNVKRHMPDGLAVGPRARIHLRGGGEQGSSSGHLCLMLLFDFSHLVRR